MSDGNKITKQETMNLSGPYKDSGNQLPLADRVANPLSLGDVFSADITLGIDYHDGTSKENILATLIHEVVYAYLSYTGNNTLQTNNHNVISEKYITPMAEYLASALGISLTDAYALAWSGVSDSNVYNPNTNPDTEYTMKDGNKITKGEIDRISGAYKLSTKNPSNNGFTKGTKICD